MSTCFVNLSTQNGPDARRHVVDRLGSMQSRLGGEELAARLAALDELDAMICYLEPEIRAGSPDSRFIARAIALKCQLETANEKLFMAARLEISRTGCSPALHHWLLRPTSDRRYRVRSGLGFDWYDDLVNGILKLRDPDDARVLRCPEMLPYQPTPARHIADLITAANISGDDVLVDLGCGVGRVPFLVSILTGCHSLGVELQPSYVACAQEAVRKLRLKTVEFVAADARSTDLSSGTVFYLFSPFTGSILESVLECLRTVSHRSQIRVCSLGPCTDVLRHQGWLKPRTQPDTERITVFDSD